ncbi:MAG: c-type cytochrome [Chloroflexi bacterium]|nr:c-type cytochrome [Chloroflexota bacterium]
MNVKQLVLILSIIIVGAASFVALGLASPHDAAATPLSAGDPVHGKYIFAAAGGCGCHGANLAGFKASGPPFGEVFNGPFGSVPAPNITSDKDAGVGSWTDDQLINAIRNGIDNEGKQLFPIMPYNNYHFMSDADVADLVAFLRTVPAVSNNVPDRKLNGPVPPAPPLPPSPAVAPTSGADRGWYLVTAIAGCGDCHTPKTPDGAPDMSKQLAGGAIAREGGKFDIAPNITPDLATGIGDWTEQQIATYLQRGIGPNGRTPDGLMGEVVFGGFGRLGFNQLIDADAAAIASFLKSIPAVANVPMAPPLPPPSAAPAPAPAAPPAGEADGSSISSAIPFSPDQPVSGTIADQPKWYQFFYAGGNDAAGVTMDFQPSSIEDQSNTELVSFRAYTHVCSGRIGSNDIVDPDNPSCSFADIGGGTPSGLPAGTKYWRHTAPSGAIYIKVYNTSGQPAGFALALTGSTFPPGGLAVPSP